VQPWTPLERMSDETLELSTGKITTLSSNKYGSTLDK
jgi:hypothetical protein